MGKAGELWDDSALINAFDDAISKYKVSPKMHGKGGRDCSFNEGIDKSAVEEKSSVLTDECLESKSHLEADDNDNTAPKDRVEVEITTNQSSTEENHSTDAFTVENHLSSSNVHHAQETEEKHANVQDTDDYNRLMNQYNELEEQRQKVLQKLYDYGGWNYEGYDNSVQGGTIYDSQEHQIPPAQTSCPTAVCSCRSYVCPFPTTSLATCCYSTTCAGKTYDATSAQIKNSISLGDGDMVKIAMGAVQRALCSVKMNASVIPEVKDKMNDEETSVAASAQNKDSKTDLTDVLNAWFSAGFYTGKYLSEQPTAKK